MSFIVEFLEKKQTALIIDKKYSLLTGKLKSVLEEFNLEVFISPEPRKTVQKFDYIFLVNTPVKEGLKIVSASKKITFIYTDNKKQALRGVEIIKQKRFSQIKIIHLQTRKLDKDLFNKILWFSLSKSKETFLEIGLLEKKKSSPLKINLSTLPLFLSFTKKKLILIALLITFLAHFLFIPPLITGSIITYQGITSLEREDLSLAKKQARFSHSLLNLTKKFYLPARHSFLLFSLALIPDTAIEINKESLKILDLGISIQENTNQLLHLILKKDKSSQERQFITLRVKKLKTDLDQFLSSINALNQNLPSNIKKLTPIKDSLTETEKSIYQVRKLIDYLDILMAKNTTKTYLIFFANNMELRPGGGFIGSFATLTLTDYSLNELKVYDVYDADGQLKAHIEPPLPIKKYLNQPHWFLRDSNFSPDFLENYIQAKMFLKKEMAMKDFAGAILITTTAIQEILEAFNKIYLPDYKETITKDNFYLKAQIHAEKGFFPGSTQKKNFLGALTRAILIGAEDASLKTLVSKIKKALDQKQIVVYIDNQAVQSMIDSFYWSGRMIEAKCLPNNTNCLIDYLFPVDANLGVNKANFFINRSINVMVRIKANGEINTELSLKIKNNSPTDFFLGGPYRNYFQLFIPKNSLIKEVTKNQTLIDDYQTTEWLKNPQTRTKNIGFFLNIKPQTSSVINIKYRLNNRLKKGRGIYQLIIQKQIGSSNNDFSLKISLPKNIHLINQNFTPLVKENLIIYNTTLSTDKIFIVELIKE